MKPVDDIDCYLDLKTLSKRSCMSVRSLRDDLKDPEHPLPYFRKGGKVYVSWCEFKEWMARFRQEAEDLDKKVEDAVNRLTGV